MERKLAAILAADVQGYSRLMGADEEGTLRTLTAYREVTDAFIQQHRGRIVGTAGDSILAEFASAVDAVQCAMAIQQALKTKNADLPSERRMEFRIGINVGDVMVEGPQIYGDGVNIAARLEALAEAGGICISGAVYDQVKNKVPLHYEDLSEQALKNIAEPVRVWRVGEPGDAATVQDRGAVAASLLPLPEIPSIAVLPFANMSHDPEQQYFGDGLTEDLITDLSKLSALFVIAHHSVFTYKGKAVKVEEVGQDLGVRYVLEGSVRKAGKRLRITAQLVDASSSQHLWAERYDRELSDIFALQDELRQKIVLALKVKLTKEEQERFLRAPTESLEAYDAYLHGADYWVRFEKEANSQARRCFAQATELDPAYAAAYTMVGRTYWAEWIWQWNPHPQVLDLALRLAQKAMALDDLLPSTHMLLANVYQWQKRHAEAIAEAERTLSLAPNYADAYADLGLVLTLAGQPEEAVRAVEQAMRLNPRYPVNYLFFLGQAYRLLRRYEEAIAALNTVLLRNPQFLTAHTQLAAAYSECGQEEAARAQVAELLKLNPQFSLEVLRERLPYKDPKEIDRYVDALRTAGLK